MITSIQVGFYPTNVFTPPVTEAENFPLIKYLLNFLKSKLKFKNFQAAWNPIFEGIGGQSLDLP